MNRREIAQSSVDSILQENHDEIRKVATVVKINALLWARRFKFEHPARFDDLRVSSRIEGDPCEDWSAAARLRLREVVTREEFRDAD